MDPSLKEVLAKLMDEKTDSSRLGCKKCGYPGHFAYQCRNDVKALLNANRTALKIEKEKAKVQMASIESRSIPPSVALSSNAFTNPNMIPITTKPSALSETNSLKNKPLESKERSHKHKSHHRKDKKRSKKKNEKKKRSKRSSSRHKSKGYSSDSDSDSSSGSDTKLNPRDKPTSSSRKLRRSRSSSPKRSKRTKESKRSRSSDDSQRESRKPRGRSRRSRDRFSRDRNSEKLREKLPYRRHSSLSRSPEALEARHSTMQSESKLDRRDKDRS